MTKYEEQYYHDIKRIADALEKLVQIFKIDIEDAKRVEMAKKFMNEPIHTLTIENPNIQYICPVCCSKNVHSMYGKINLDGSNNRIHYICENCHTKFDVSKDKNEIFI